MKCGQITNNPECKYYLCLQCLVVPHVHDIDLKIAYSRTYFRPEVQDMGQMPKEILCLKEKTYLLELFEVTKES